MQVTTALYPLGNFKQLAPERNEKSREKYSISSTSYYPAVKIRPLTFKVPTIKGIDGKIFDYEGNLLDNNMEVIAKDRMTLIDDRNGEVVYCDIDTIALYNIATQKGWNLVNHITKTPLTEEVYLHVRSYIESRIHTITFFDGKYVATLYGFYTTTYGSLLVSCLRMHLSHQKESTSSHVFNKREDIDILFNDGRSLFEVNLFERIEREETNLSLESVNIRPKYDKFISYYFDSYSIENFDLIDYVINLISSRDLEVSSKTLSQALEIPHPEILHMFRNQLLSYLKENDPLVTKDMVIKFLNHPYFIKDFSELKFPRDVVEKIMKPYSLISSQEDYTHLNLIKLMLA